jgi:hypothetical protein
MFIVLETSFLSHNTRFIHCILALFYYFSDFPIGKRKNNQTTKKECGNESHSPLLVAFDFPLNKEQIFYFSLNNLGLVWL